jgi:Histidine kinase-, DNA gyrase B-, and HSP90-like ATPase
MTRSPRLSLRARLLAGLIAVTAVFLVIMGTVSTFVISGHLSAQFRVENGSGLGLSIVQAIAAAHNGHADLVSAPGHGTRVRVWLPAQVVSRDVAPP